MRNIHLIVFRHHLCYIKLAGAGVAPLCYLLVIGFVVMQAADDFQKDIPFNNPAVAKTVRNLVKRIYIFYFKSYAAIKVEALSPAHVQIF